MRLRGWEPSEYPGRSCRRRAAELTEWLTRESAVLHLTGEVDGMAEMAGVSRG